MLLARILAVLAVLAACGGKKSADPPPGKDDAAVAGPRVAPIALPPLGVDRVARMNFIYDAGAPLYEKALGFRKKKDWGGVKTECEAAIAKDPIHLDAHWLLATAQAHAGDHAAAALHLATALAGDYTKYGPALGADADLVEFLATPHGKAVAALALQIRGEYAKRIANGVWLVARRSTFKWAKESGVQSSSSRGEVYVFDRESKRYLRITHTGHEVVGFVRAASGDEVALVGFDKLDRPKGDDAPPLFAHAWVQVLDTKDWKVLGPRAGLPAARAVSLGYGAGDELVVSTAPAAGRWTTGAETVSSIDRTTGKLAQIEAAATSPRIELTLDDGRAVRPPGVKTTLAADGRVAAIKTDSGVAITIPEAGEAAPTSVASAPDAAHVAFATYVDPCAKDIAPSLYVADAKSGALKHVLTARSRFATRWIDAATLAYEDGDNAIRLWDAKTGREALRLDNKAGVALDVLALASAPLCKQAPPAAATAGAGSGDEPMPKEDPP